METIEITPAMRVSLTDHFPAFISQAVRERRLELASAGC